MFRARVRCHGNAITTPPVWAQTHVVEIISRNNQYATNRTREPNIYYLRRRLYVILAPCVCVCVCVLGLSARTKKCMQVATLCAAVASMCNSNSTLRRTSNAPRAETTAEEQHERAARRVCMSVFFNKTPTRAVCSVYHKSHSRTRRAVQL